MTVEERWSFIEARRLESLARTARGEFLPDISTEGLDVEAEFRDAQLAGDDEQMGRCVEEAGERGDAWKRIAWYEDLIEHARKERDMRLFRSAAESIRIAAEQEFHRREAGDRRS